MDYLDLEYHEDGIAVIHLNDRKDKVNKLSKDMLTELENCLQQIEDNPRPRGLVFISDKENNFLAGADLKEMAKVTQPGAAREMIHRVHAIFSRIEQMPFPVVAAIHGHCLGGGMELALACHYRIATEHPKTQLGLPEVKLGLIPAGGGCQRLTRLIGATKALPLLLEGKTLSASHAKSLGAIDLKVYPHSLLEIARRTVSRLQEKLPKENGYPTFPSTDWMLRYIRPFRRIFFRIVRSRVHGKTRGNYPAPELLLDCVETGISQGLSEGFKAEAEAFEQLVHSPQSKALRQLFFATNALKKNPLADQATPVRRLGVLGAGLMGSGISSVSAKNGLHVILKDVSWDHLGQGMKQIWKEFEGRVKRHKWRPVDRDQAHSRVYPSTNYEPFTQVDLVIEAVFEDLDIKHRVLREVEEYADPDCIFASNTSAIPISKIASASNRPEMVVGMHYFSPVPRMPLLEIVVKEDTPDWVKATAISVGQKQGKTVIAVNDGPGFYTSRILSPYIQEAVMLLHERAEIDQIDEEMQRFGFPVGPLKLLDEVGIEVAAHVSEDLREFFGVRGFPHDNRLQLLIREDFHGRKNGRGFYQYSSNWRKILGRLPGVRPSKPINKEIYRFFGGANRVKFDEAEIKERLALIMMNEAAQCFQDGIIQSPRDGDVGAVLGLGFPPFLGGPFRHMDETGIQQIVSDLEKWADKKGARFKPAAILVEMAEKGDVFYKKS